MSIEATVSAILVAASVASGKVFPNAAGQDVAAPLVIYRVVQVDPLMTLQGPTGDYKSTMSFESWAPTMALALSTRAAVQAAINAAFTTLGGYMQEPGEVAYDPDDDQHMAPCVYSFWHR